MTRSRIYLVEDHATMRSMIGDFLDARKDLQISGSAATAEEAFDELANLDVDLVLVDTSLPDMSGIDLVKRLLDRQPDVSCLMYSGHSEATYVHRALRAGAKGYVVKGNPRELPAAIRQVLDGSTYLSPDLRDGESVT